MKMLTEIYIENRKLDISQDLSNLLTFVIDDIKAIGDRYTSFSKTIILPGTANNNFLFGHIFDVRVGNFYNSSEDNVGMNFNAAKSAECRIFQDHIQVFKGVIRLLEVVIDNDVKEYECAVFGELGGLVPAIGNKKLEELDFSAYDHTWDATNITNSWDTINGSGYYYPLIDFGGVSTGKVDYDIKAFRPAFYVKEYIDKIFEAAGYSFASDLMDSARFKSLIVPNNRKEFQRATYTLINASRASSAEIINSGSSSNVDVDMSSYQLYLFTGGAAVFTYSGSDSIATNVQLSFTGSYIGNTTGYKLSVYKNGVEQTAFTKTLAQTNDTNTHFFGWTIAGDIGFTTGDTIKIMATELGSATGTDNLRLIAGTFKVVSYTAINVDIAVGNTVQVNETLPRNVLQKDFLASVLKLFNIYVTDDKYKSKFVNMTPYVDFYDLNASGIVDWTYKVDRSKPIKIKPMSELNSRYYNFKFKEDKDYYNDNYRQRYFKGFGDYTYDSEYEFVNEKTDIELIFSPTVIVGYAGTDKVVPAMYKKNLNIEERIDTNLRILQAKKITGVTNWSIKNGASTLSTETDYGYGGNYDDPDAPSNDIHFGVPNEVYFTLATGNISSTQFNVYWSSYMAEITDKDSKLLTAYFKLTRNDINNLDFSKLIYIDGAYFRLNKVEDWNANEPDVCKCSLLKVINTVY